MPKFKLKQKVLDKKKFPKTMWSTSRQKINDFHDTICG